MSGIGRRDHGGGFTQQGVEASGELLDAIGMGGGDVERFARVGGEVVSICFSFACH